MIFGWKIHLVENIVNAIKRWEKLVSRLNEGSEARGEDIGPGGFQANKSVEDHEIVEEYNNDNICRNFKFKQGMKFCSLKRLNKLLEIVRF